MGTVVVSDNDARQIFAGAVAERFEAATPGTMLSEGVCRAFGESVEVLGKAGADLRTGGQIRGGTGVCFADTLPTVSGTGFLRQPETFQTEVFGNVSLFVLADSVDQMEEIAENLEGNLTGCICSATDGSDDTAYD